MEITNILLSNEQYPVSIWVDLSKKLDTSTSVMTFQTPLFCSTCEVNPRTRYQGTRKRNYLNPKSGWLPSEDTAIIFILVKDREEYYFTPFNESDGLNIIKG